MIIQHLQLFVKVINKIFKICITQNIKRKYNNLKIYLSMQNLNLSSIYKKRAFKFKIITSIYGIILIVLKLLT